MGKTSAKVAFCGVLSALCLALMLCSTVLPFLTYTMPAISGILLMIAALSMGGKAAWLIYGCVTVLSLLFLTDKECAVVFALFFGYYPILKLQLDRLKNRFAKWGCKLLLFNAAAVISQLLMIVVFGMPLEAITEGLGQWALPVLLAMGNLLFGCYEWMLSQLRRGYCLKWHRYVERFFHR